MIATPQHGDRGTCSRCFGVIEYVEYALQTSHHEDAEVLDAWWAHHNHPDDDHDADPHPDTYFTANYCRPGGTLLPADERAFSAALDVLAAAPPRRRRWWRR